jgi:hypothetical protein
MTFRCKYEPPCKTWVTKERADAGKDASKVEVIRLPTDMDLFAFKLRAPRHLLINEAIELSGIAK